MTRLSPQEIERRKYLVSRLREKTLTIDEGQELQQLLAKEKEEASEAGNFLVVLGILFLLGLLIAYLAGDK